MIGRRGFLLGIGAAVAAPMIVRAASLMAVKSVPSLLAGELGIFRGFQFIETTAVSTIITKLPRIEPDENGNYWAVLPPKPNEFAKWLLSPLPTSTG